MDYTPFFNALIRVEYLALQVVVVWLIVLFAKLFPKLMHSKTYARTAPLLPLVGCVGGSLIPGVHPPEMTLGMKLILGLILGATAGHVYKMIRQAVMGEDSRIHSGPKFELPPITPLTSEPPPTGVEGTIDRKIELPKKVSEQRKWAQAFGVFLGVVAAIFLGYHVLRIAGCVGQKPVIVEPEEEPSPLEELRR